MTSVLTLIKDRFNKALKVSFQLDIDPMIALSSNERYGDYQCNIALSISKRLGIKPRDIAESIINNLDIEDICEPPEIGGAGFINLRLKRSYIQSQLLKMYINERLDIPLTDKKERIVVDFSSPNIAKEMHVGHLRSTIIGDSISNLLEFMGHDVLRLNHVGDWGTQFGMLLTYLKEEYPSGLIDTIHINDLVLLYKKAKERFDSDEVFKDRARQEVVRLQTGDPSSIHIWNLLCEQSREEFQFIYDLLYIKLHERGESFYNPYLGSLIEELDEKGLLEESDGALCIFLDGFTNKEGEPLPLIVKKADGGYNYATTDLAALKYRVNEDKATRIIYVTDNGQSTHFNQVFQVAERAGWLSNIKVEHITFGLVLGEDGKRMKTRSGESIRLRDLLSEAIDRAKGELLSRVKAQEGIEDESFITHTSKIIGLSAVKYADISQHRTSNYTFSFDRMLALNGNTAPYLLYSYTRIKGIERKGGKNTNSTDIPIFLLEEAELSLGKHLLQLTDVLIAMEKDLLPHRLCEYLYELSKRFNVFYERCPVNNEPHSIRFIVPNVPHGFKGQRSYQSNESLRSSRLILCNITARTIQLGLSILGIPVLERM